MRQKVRVTLIDTEQYDRDFPPTNAIECVEWFVSRLQEIPEQYRNSATIEIASISGWEGDHHGSIEITYVRPETDEEQAVRKQNEAEAAKNRRDQELKMLASLQAKYNLGD